jgi:spoIIIJ-associated protein
VETPQSIEAVGTTIEDAITRGLEALNAERRDVEIEVLSDATAREARVRLILKSQSQRPQPAAPAAIAPMTTAISAEDTAAACRVLTTLLEKMKTPAEVAAHTTETALEHDRLDGPTLVLDIRGEDLGGLIGRRGETLDHLQYLARLLIAKEIGHYINLVIDVEGYKSHRMQVLQQLAQRMAERVVTLHKPVALEPMPANERRIIHLTLRDHPDVRTESVGSGDNRKVTIIPKDLKR